MENAESTQSPVKNETVATTIISIEETQSLGNDVVSGSTEASSGSGLEPTTTQEIATEKIVRESKGYSTTASLSATTKESSIVEITTPGEIATTVTLDTRNATGLQLTTTDNVFPTIETSYSTISTNVSKTTGIGLNTTKNMSGMGTTVSDVSTVESTILGIVTETEGQEQTKPIVTFSELPDDLDTTFTSENNVGGVSTLSSLTTGPLETTSNTNQQPVILDTTQIAIIAGGSVLLIIVLIVVIILACKKRKKAESLKKSRKNDAWITRSEAGGVALSDLTFNPKIDLEAGNVDPEASRLSGLADAPVVNIFANNNSAFDEESHASDSVDAAAKRSTLRESRINPNLSNTPERKAKGLTPAVVPTVTTPAKSSSLDDSSLLSEPLSPLSITSGGEDERRQKSFLYQSTFSDRSHESSEQASSTAGSVSALPQTPSSVATSPVPPPIIPEPPSAPTPPPAPLAPPPPVVPEPPLAPMPPPPPPDL